MSRLWLPICLLVCAWATTPSAADDLVLQWNAIMRDVIQHEGTNQINQANPGWATRSMAMVNGAIYDIVQGFERTHRPFLVEAAPDAETSLDAAIHQAAYELLQALYPTEGSLLDAEYTLRMGVVAEGAAKQKGIALGQAVVQAYLANRAGDNSDDATPYLTMSGPGHWQPDPFHPMQTAWGPKWGTVRPFAIDATQPYIDQLPDIPGLDSPEYAAAYEEVRLLGARDSSTRSDEQTEVGIFWGYDRPTMGPPPVLFNRSLGEIAAQAGNSQADNARLFALASVAMADAAIAAWDAKFKYDLWRPVTAIHEALDDGNDLTDPDPFWEPLGAPGDPLVAGSDFTPPFPAWPSGHATMGGALFEALRLFYGTNVFDEIDGILGNDPQFALTSQEMEPSDLLPGVDGIRTFTHFSALLDSANPHWDSPEWENAVSRIYLGIHWRFDATDGITLGNLIARDIAAGYFTPVPEPSAAGLFALGAVVLCAVARRRRAARNSSAC